MVDIRIVRAERKDLDDLVPLFDGYRQFYGQRSDLAAARAFLRDRIERDESVIYLAYTKPREAAGFTQLYPSFSSISLTVLRHAPTGSEGATASSMQLADILGNALGTGLGAVAVAAAVAGSGNAVIGVAVTDGLAGCLAIVGIFVASRLRTPNAAALG